jgi:hypothetical protein
MGSAPRRSIDVWARGACLKLDKPVPRGRQVLSYSKSHIVRITVHTLFVQPTKHDGRKKEGAPRLVIECPFTPLGLCSG